MLSSPAPLLGNLFSENIGKREVLTAEDLLDFSQCRRLLAICKTVQGRFSDPELAGKAGITLLTAQSFQEVRVLDTIPRRAFRSSQDSRGECLRTRHLVLCKNSRLKTVMRSIDGFRFEMLDLGDDSDCFSIRSLAARLSRRQNYFEKFNQRSSRNQHTTAPALTMLRRDNSS